MTRRALTSDIARRREFVKNSQLTGSVQNQLSNVQPDYMLAYAIAILTHLPMYASHNDVPTLERLKSAMWFILEPLMLKPEAFIFGFYKQLVEKLKVHVVASDPENEALNQKMWALCDIAHTLLMSKNCELTDVPPMEPVIPQSHFKPHSDPNFTNTTLYIPSEIASTIKTKTVYVAPATARALKRIHQRDEANNVQAASKTSDNGGGAGGDKHASNGGDGDDDGGENEENEVEENEDAIAAKHIKLEEHPVEEGTAGGGRPRRATRRN